MIVLHFVLYLCHLLMSVPAVLLQLTVADIAVSIYVQWLTSGLLDGVPKTVLQPFPLLQELVTNTMAHPKIAAYYAARS
jgi:Glutathione S-transferase, C-terminal domain